MTVRAPKRRDHVVVVSAQPVLGRRLLRQSTGYAIIDFVRLVPWQPVLDRRIGQRISAVMRNVGGIEWSFGSQEGVGLRMFPRSYKYPRKRHLLVAMGPDRRHPVKADAHRASPLHGQRP
jgi:uncharacterized protein DUF3363